MKMSGFFGVHWEHRLDKSVDFDKFFDLYTGPLRK